jgi:hypothetical protein
VPGVGADGGEGVDDVASVGAQDVEHGERSQLFERDFAGECCLDAKRADDDVSEDGAVGEGGDGVDVGGEGAAEVGGLLQLAEE